MTPAATIVTDEQRRQFATDGFFVLERAIPAEHLEVLRRELDVFIGRIDAQMDAQGTDALGLNHRGRRYFVENCHRESAGMSAFLFSDLLAEICRATLGDTAYLFWEQYVVKFAEVGLRFSWHQDSGYLGTLIPGYTRPYVTCWCALDDMSEENGTIHVLPFSRAGTRDIVAHAHDPEVNDLVGYHGDDPGDPMVVPAGSIVVFSTTVLHRSGANTTDRPRRSYVAQYTAEPVPWPDPAAARGFAEPLLIDGRRVQSEL